MKQLVYTLLLLVLWTLSGTAQQKRSLDFTSDGDFKVVQFTDTHINLEEGKNLQVFDVISSVLAAEKPQLAVLTGDIASQHAPREIYRKLAAIFEAEDVPWVVVFGNHDARDAKARKELANFVEQFPGCLNHDVGTLTGSTNFVLTVKGQTQKTAALLYCMDSNAYSTLKPKVDGYGWFDFSQVNWYLQKSRDYTAANAGQPLPALAFFHIPLPEYTQAWNNQLAPPIGVKNEDECSPDINTGMFAAMLHGGDVMGTFTGHDHINDYIGVFHGIALAYGRVTKVMRNEEDPKAGGRVIVLQENQRQFKTWIREWSGNKVLECSFPGSFQEKEQAAR
ncbi:metallophosphoesterase family protein [Sunxiuqinia elliptica]|uniref:3',5'-cyclic AMP phosphodiesterase CpdA n=1 Tax=Sunxiuqinia elliptica TaxID=655355 RepID=A0A4R6GQU9_9BACT|nr:metallophosphoesterase family protein [Sunxiuqinia elliptica]TDN97669.1 3',5'-cyclic AMP phosphodiesterase CpdA [Sunxiuqinia elliptica]TDO67024.1 3',5'-cyclic AMP phosphodiesterase CpdA [Sunxiuqinia elliptica]